MVHQIAENHEIEEDLYRAISARMQTFLVNFFFFEGFYRF